MYSRGSHVTRSRLQGGGCSPNCAVWFSTLKLFRMQPTPVPRHRQPSRVGYKCWPPMFRQVQQPKLAAQGCGKKDAALGCGAETVVWLFALHVWGHKCNGQCCQCFSSRGGTASKVLQLGVSLIVLLLLLLLLSTLLAAPPGRSCAQNRNRSKGTFA